MSYANRVWYISDFLEEISKEIKSQFPNETFSIHMNTVDNWFKRMEKEKIHFTHRDNFQRRIYDDTDLKIACYLYEETKINDTKIGIVFSFKFGKVKTRPYDVAKKDIFEINKEAFKFFDHSAEKSKEVKSPSAADIRQKTPNSNVGKTPIELMEILKKEITFNGQKMTPKEKQRIIDFLSGLVWSKTNL